MQENELGEFKDLNYYISQIDNYQCYDNPGGGNDYYVIDNQRITGDITIDINENSPADKVEGLAYMYIKPFIGSLASITSALGDGGSDAIELNQEKEFSVNFNNTNVLVEPAPTYTYTWSVASAGENGGKAEITSSTDSSVTLKAKKAGNVNLSVTIKKNENSLGTVTKPVTINKISRDIELTYSPNNSEQAWNTPITLTATVDENKFESGETVQFLCNGEAIPNGTATIDTKGVATLTWTPTGIGPYTLTAKIGATDTYAAATSDTVEYAPEKVEQSFELVPTLETVAYGDEGVFVARIQDIDGIKDNPTFTAALKEGETNGTVSVEDLVVEKQVFWRPSRAGKATIVVKKKGDENYSEATREIPVEAEPKAISISQVTATDKDYDGKANVNITVQVEGLVEEDKSYNQNLIGTVSSADAGTYSEVTFDINQTGIDFTNYTLAGAADLTLVSSDLADPVTISKKPLNITLPDGTVEWQNRSDIDSVKNADGTAITSDDITITGGFVGSDTAESLASDDFELPGLAIDQTVFSDTTKTEFANAIIVDEKNSGNATGNYEFQVTNGSLTLTPQTVSDYNDLISVANESSKNVYQDPDTKTIYYSVQENADGTEVNPEIAFNIDGSDYNKIVSDSEDVIEVINDSTVKLIDSDATSFKIHLEGDAAYEKTTSFEVKLVKDDTAPTAKIQISASSKIWEELVELISFGIFSNRVEEVMIFDEADTGSGVASIEHLIKDLPMTKEDLDDQFFDDAWMHYEDSFYVMPDQPLIVFARITDRVGNYTYISTDGVILDDTQAAISFTAPEGRGTVTLEDQTVVNLYDDDVPVTVVMEDTLDGGTFSGLKSAEYEVRNNGAVTQSGSFDINAGDQTKEAEIVVDSQKNDDHNIQIYVKATDRAENVSEAVYNLAIDTSLPKITRVECDMPDQKPWNEAVEIRAVLMDKNGNEIREPGRKITFTFDNGETKTAETDEDGAAAVAYTPGYSKGTDETKITASFAGDDSYATSTSETGSYTAAKVTPVLTLTPDPESQTSDWQKAVTLTGTLTYELGDEAVPVSGEEIAFAVSGGQSFTGIRTTGEDGTASVTWQPENTAEVTMTASHTLKDSKRFNQAAGDEIEGYAPGLAAQSFTISDSEDKKVENNTALTLKYGKDPAEFTLTPDDADGDVSMNRNFEAEVSDGNIISAEVESGALTITPVNAGTATVRITQPEVKDYYNESAQTLTFTVLPYELNLAAENPVTTRGNAAQGGASGNAWSNEKIYDGTNIVDARAQADLSNDALSGLTPDQITELKALFTEDGGSYYLVREGVEARSGEGESAEPVTHVSDSGKAFPVTFTIPTSDGGYQNFVFASKTEEGEASASITEEAEVTILPRELSLTLSGEFRRQFHTENVNDQGQPNVVLPEDVITGVTGFPENETFDQDPDAGKVKDDICALEAGWDYLTIDETVIGLSTPMGTYQGAVYMSRDQMDAFNEDVLSKVSGDYIFTKADKGSVIIGNEVITDITGAISLDTAASGDVYQDGDRIYYGGDASVVFTASEPYNTVYVVVPGEDGASQDRREISKDAPLTFDGDPEETYTFVLAQVA